jgi:hypothetical protein
MASGRKRRWTGELARPIRPRVNRPRGLAVTDIETVTKANNEMNDLYRAAIQEQFLEKLLLLMEHYEISDKEDWFSLALALAIDHVPGFRVSLRLALEGGQDLGAVVHRDGKKVGRRRLWTSDRLERLLDAVEQEKKKSGIRKDREALSRLARRQEWARPATHRKGHLSWIETLESRLQDAKKFKRLVDRKLKELRDIARQIASENSGNSKRV